MKMITTKQASNILGISERRVRQLIKSNKLQATRVGRDWVISESSLAEVKVYGHAGRPKIKK
jgi:excisionase family DNA binding protein